MNQDEVRRRLQELAASAPEDERKKLEALIVQIDASRTATRQALQEASEERMKAKEQGDRMMDLVMAPIRIRAECDEALVSALLEQNTLLERIVRSPGRRP